MTGRNALDAPNAKSVLAGSANVRVLPLPRRLPGSRPAPGAQRRELLAWCAASLLALMLVALALMTLLDLAREISALGTRACSPEENCRGWSN